MIQFCKFQFIELIKGALLYTFGCVVRCAGLHHTKASLMKREVARSSRDGGIVMQSKHNKKKRSSI